MKHVILLGDSVFDNAAYVGGGPDVIHQLQHAIGPGNGATLAAKDGAVIAGLSAQLAGVPTDATHLVVSVGGNDALRAATVLGAPARSVADALDQLAAIADTFRGPYAAMLDEVLRRGLPTAVCTIYDPRFPDPLQRRRSSVALAVLNDAITREAFARSVTLLDLRSICGADEDFANPIEPSVTGGRKIVDAVLRFVGPARSGGQASQVIAG